MTDLYKTYKSKKWMTVIVSLGLSILVVAVALFVPWLPLPLTPEAARKQLEDQNIAFTVDEFIARAGDPDAVGLFIKAGMDPNARGTLGTALHALASYALEEGFQNHSDSDRLIRSARILIKYKADINAEDDQRYTPLLRHLSYARMPGSYEVNFDFLKFLLDNGASTERRGGLGRTPLMIAAECHNFEAMELLLRNKHADVRQTDSFGANALMVLLDGDCEKLKRPPVRNDALLVEKAAIKLLALGVDVNSRDNRGQSALHHAVGYPNVAKLLLERGIPVDIRENRENYTPLMMAVIAGNVDTTELLLWAGAQVNAQDGAGNLVTNLALEQWARYAVSNSFVLLGARLSAGDKMKPLAGAVESASVSEVQKEALKDQRVLYSNYDKILSKLMERHAEYRNTANTLAALKVIREARPLGSSD